MRKLMLLLLLTISAATPLAHAAGSAPAAHPPRGAIARAMADLTGALREASLQAKAAREAQRADAVPAAGDGTTPPAPAQVAAKPVAPASEALAQQPERGGR